jgi:cystathionine beta-lyase/cystathionine gamma-synthase
MRLAEWLEGRPEVAHVYYPGLASHPQHDLAERQMRMPGAMIAFDLAGGYDPSVKLMNVMARRNTPMELAVSLGATTTYIQHPASMTHAGMPPEERARRGITDGLIRVSVGLEGYDFLRGGLEQGFREVAGGQSSRTSSTR